MQLDMEMATKAYAELSEQEKEIVREAVDSPLMGILAKVFGQEFAAPDDPITCGDYLTWRFNKAFAYRTKNEKQ